MTTPSATNQVMDFALALIPLNFINIIVIILSTISRIHLVITCFVSERVKPLERNLIRKPVVFTFQNRSLLRHP